MKYLWLTILLVASDLLVKWRFNYFRGQLTRALIDNSNHGLAGAISWLMVMTWKGAIITDRLVLIESVICFMMASAVDVDHFIEAKSFYLEDVLKPGHTRPFLHCTTTILVMFAGILISAVVSHSWWVHILSYIFLTATIGHHLRDAIRHGLWFCPFGSTRPIYYPLYLAIIILMPVVCCYMMDLSGALVLRTSGNAKETPFKYSSLPTEIV